MKDRLFDALSKSTADYAEIRIETEEALGVGYRGKEVDSASSSKMTGGIVRACVKGGWGLATFDSPDNLEHYLSEACQSARLVGREKTRLAEVEPAQAERPAHLEHDPRGVPMDRKLKLIARYNDMILKADPAIESSRVSYGEHFRTVHFASTRGAYFMEQRPRIVLIFVAVARDGSLVQQALDSVSSAVTYDVVEGLEERVDTVARRAVALLKAPQCEGGRYTVIADQRLGGVFAHEAFGHLSEADFLYENPKMRQLMHLGRKMGVKQLNIVDDGTMPGLLGTQSFDDEGTPAQKTYLIKEGVLSGHLHSLETAGKMDARPTGNARAIDRSSRPIVRMTNTYIEPGRQSFDELIADVDKGIYACDMIGGQTMMEMFTFSAGHAYRIEGGRIGQLVRDVVLTGNVFETLNAIDGFGDDMLIGQTAGGCGKGGQSPLPVSFGSPHLRIRDVVVGGT